MARYISESRLQAAVVAIHDWRRRSHSQGSKHLFPLLSLIEKDVGTGDFTRYEESDDFEFFDRYFRVGGNAAKPYFDPLQRDWRVASHPHSNTATARKGTFEKSWGAGQSEARDVSLPDNKSEKQTFWKLVPNWLDIFAGNAISRGGQEVRAPVLDFASWLFRQEEFPDDATAKLLERRFRETFPLSDAEYVRLFLFRDEPPETLFSDIRMSDEDVVKVVTSTIVESESKPPAQTPVGEVEIASEIDDEDLLLAEVLSVLDIGSSGIILRGAPGTSKSWYAWQIALRLTHGKPDHVVRVQFHPSFGYEDFVEGYSPSEETKSGFKVVPKSFLRSVEKAREAPDDWFVYIIDEINRGDTARIFGELLTYIEAGWREVPFRLPYTDEEVRVPRNLIILATMNPHDRSITQLDMALLRRFDHIDVPPSKDKVREFLEKASSPPNSGLSPVQIGLIVEWFDKVQQIVPNTLGHTYFLNVNSIDRLATVWRYRVEPFLSTVLAFDDQSKFENARRSYEKLHKTLLGQTPGGDGGE